MDNWFELLATELEYKKLIDSITIRNSFGIFLDSKREVVLSLTSLSGS